MLADKSLWDDLDLLRLYDEQLKIDAEQQLSKSIPVGNSFLDGVSDETLLQNNEMKESDSASHSQSDSSTLSTSSSIIISRKNDVDVENKEINANHNKSKDALPSTSLPFEPSLFPSFLVPSCRNASPHPLWKSLEPLLKGYFDAGYAAGKFSSVLENECTSSICSPPKKRKR